MSDAGPRSCTNTVNWTTLLLGLLISVYVARNFVFAGPLIDEGPSDFAHSHFAARELIKGHSPYSIRGFIYPPAALIPVLPTAHLSYTSARVVWFWISHFCLLLAAVFTWRHLGGGGAAAVAVAAAWTGAGTVAENLVLGQINPLLLVLVAAGIFLATRHDEWMAAAVGVAASLKIWPGVLMAVPAMRRRWRAVAVGAVMVLLLGVVPAALVRIFLPLPHRPAGDGHWAGTPAFMSYSIPATALRLVDPPDRWSEMPTSWVIGNRLEDLELPESSAALSIAVALLTLGFGLWLVERAGPSSRSVTQLAVAVIAIALAAAPTSWYHYRLLHLPGLAWLGWILWRQRQWTGLVFLASIALVISWAHLPHLGLDSLSVDPRYVLVRGAVIPTLELVLASWFLTVNPDRPGQEDGSGSASPRTPATSRDCR